MNLLLVLLAAMLLATRIADADPATTIYEARAAGCGGELPAATGLELSDALNDVARELSRGGELSDAVKRVGYPAKSSASIYLDGPTDDATIREIIEADYCALVMDPRFTDVGAYRSGNETWIVLAARAEQPAEGESAAIAAHVLELVNAARAESRRCGRRRFEAVRPLTLSPALTQAASLHARDMAEHGTLDHRGSDGSQPAERVSRAGYNWRAVGENVAAGQSSAEAVVAGWLDSRGHCENIMSRQFTEMGVAFAPAPSKSPSIYWAQVFAAPE